MGKTGNFTPENQDSIQELTEKKDISDGKIKKEIRIEKGKMWYYRIILL